MRQDILKIAAKKFLLLSKKYDKFLIVVVDDWRGYRFVFDTEDVKRCNNVCVNCDLFKLLKSEKEKLFSAALYPASRKDKNIFGPQNFLNCKTLEQYGRCYLNFIKKIKNKKELIEELKLISNLKIIYSRNKKASEVEKNFKNFIFSRAIKEANNWKKSLIRNYFITCSGENRR